MSLAEAETELAMVLAGDILVTALEDGRIEGVSYANRITRHDKHEDYWFLPSFRPSYRAYRAEQAILPDEWPFIVDADIRQYFPSLELAVVFRALCEEVGLSKKDLTRALALLSEVTAKPKHLPVGPELSSVIGTALLTPVDRELVARVGTTGVVRWVDDITFGATSRNDGQKALTAISHGHLAGMGLVWHPVKTHVTPAEDWVPREPSIIDNAGPEDVREDGELPLLTRPRVRAELERLSETVADDEHRAYLIADRLGSMACDAGRAIRAIAKAGPSPIVGDSACSSLRKATRAAFSDSAAEALIDLAAAGVPYGRDGRDALVAIASSPDIPVRTRAAGAWYLASSGTFDRRVLDSIETMRPYGVRAVLAGAARAGAAIGARSVSRAIN